MQKGWPSYRMTAVLYVIVLLMPVGFYFVHHSFQTMKHDTKVIRQVSWLAGGIGYHYLDPTMQQVTQKQIESTLHDLSVWVSQNSHSEYYIGEASLQKDFERVAQCWDNYSVSAVKNGNDLSASNLKCYDDTETLALIIEKMVYLKQNKIVNLFYSSLFITMLLLIAAIHFVRVYIHLQMKKHAIHDEESTLFNKKYFLSVLQKVCAESKRYKTPLSVLWVSVEFENSVSKNAKKRFFREFGSVVLCSVRNSDVAARYSDPASKSGKILFCILLPMTSKEHGEVLLDRLRNDLETHLSPEASKQTLNFSIEECDQEETYEVFIERGKSALL